MNDRPILSVKTLPPEKLVELQLMREVAKAREARRKREPQGA